MSVSENIQRIKSQLPSDVTLVAVSKTQPISSILQAYDAGQRIFGENKIQEMADKHSQLPQNIQWHMIGHVQTNKVKIMAPFVSLIHGVDSFKLLVEINKQAAKNNRVIDCLLQIHIATEDTKFGLDEGELDQILNSDELPELTNITIKGLMGMATFTDDESVIKREFSSLKTLFDNYSADFNFSTLSMGMSGDYKIAIDSGSNMVRIGSSIFGARNH
ncbi:MAG: YggS family pyridoxal phosphate-dependent enzyme [Flavobacterium sp.]|nr:YggS family pyridoxal phosphate-dependent enzyme [Flavobacterium sp.]